MYFPDISQTIVAIFAAIRVLQTWPVPTGDLIRVGAPLVLYVVEPVIGALSEAGYYTALCF